MKDYFTMSKEEKAVELKKMKADFKAVEKVIKDYDDDQFDDLVNTVSRLFENDKKAYNKLYKFMKENGFNKETLINWYCYE
jgi:SOS response regulatory protein OraA/RecX